VKELIRHLESGRPVPLSEVKIIRLDGTLVDVETSAAPFQEDGVPAIQVVFRDISDRKKLQEQFHQAQKMEAIGKLAGGIAHDFNNLLTVISGYSDILIAPLPAHDPMRGFLHEIQKAGERAAHLTRQLLAFSRKAVVEPRVLDLNSLVTETEKMLRRLIGEDISLTTTLARALGQVKADAGQVEQVIVNLAVNARDAMPQGGKLTIETCNVELGNEYAMLHPEVKPGAYVMLAVSDTGSGMSQETKARIFEPFFTTKGLGQGTGLGLATVYGIVKQSEGHLDVHTDLGRGTSFKIYLPSVNGNQSSSKSNHGVKIAPHGKETILLVEDEESVRRMTKLALRSLDYTVLEAENGEQAIRVCEQHKQPIHLLMTDVVMPQMGGRQVAERLTACRQGIKVLFVSGYTDDAVVRHGVLQAEVAFLQKPFTQMGLARKVREVLDG
jgi:two-component system, cell cycle sensor histidine kinase and response regulator CckA